MEHQTQDGRLDQFSVRVFSPKIGHHIEDVNDYYTAEGFFRRLHALLAIKRPRAGTEPVQVSSAQTQLVDVAPTIYDIVGIKGAPADGQSVFLLTDASPPREINFFTGISLKNERGEDAKLGRARASRLSAGTRLADPPQRPCNALGLVECLTRGVDEDNMQALYLGRDLKLGYIR